MTTCCKTAATSRELDAELAQGLPAGDPSSLTEPVGDARDAAGCCCSPEAGQKPEPARTATPQGCCGGKG
jgi:hypothetical protein